MQINLSGQVAIITGGTGQLGGAISRGLHAAGAIVVPLSTRLEKAEAFAAELGEPALGLQADVTDADSLRAVAEVVMGRFGRLDILVNAAGGNQPGATATADRPFFDLLPDDLRAVMDLNLMGTLLPSQVFGKIMAEAGQGSILNISSMAASRPLTRVVGYGASKAAIDNFTRWLAVYMAREYNPAIRVNALAPGFFLTEQNRYLLTDAQTGELTPRGQQILAHTPMGRFGEPEDLIGAAVWLLSDAARFVTGVVLPVDGGFSAYSGV